MGKERFLFDTENIERCFEVWVFSFEKIDKCFSETIKKDDVDEKIYSTIQHNKKGC